MSFPTVQCPHCNIKIPAKQVTHLIGKCLASNAPLSFDQGEAKALCDAEEGGCDKEFLVRIKRSISYRVAVSSINWKEA